MVPAGSGRRASGVPGRALSFVPSLTGTGNAPSKRDNRVIVNVGGVRYETYKSTLKNIPDTRLAWLTETTAQNPDYDPDTGEYFFDRHPGMFTMILNYYRTGRLHVPIDVCGPLFEEELIFWGIDERQIEPCCWMTYRTHRDAQETLKELEGEDDSDDNFSDGDNVAERFGIYEEQGPRKSCWQKYQPRVWQLLEDPYSSKGAEIMALLSLMFILLSIATFCLETLPECRTPRNASGGIDVNWSTQEMLLNTSPHVALDVLDFVCVGYFTVELFVRFMFCPVKLNFFKIILNWVDLLSIVPFYVEKILFWINPSLEHTIVLYIFRIIRLIRIFRIFKLTRHFSGLKILVHTVKASMKELMLLIMFLLISLLIFGCLIYYAETVLESDKNYFKNIPVGFWWAVVTMTTLGYGDMYPQTGLGYLVGGVCAVAGVLVLALPVPVIVNNFALYYSHAQARLKLPKRTKRILVNAHDVLKTQVSLPTNSDISQNDEPSTRTPPKPQHGQQEVVSSSHTRESRDSHPCSRQTSVESVNDSTDSGIKTFSNSSSESSTGISVIFTDENSRESTPHSFTHDYLANCVADENRLALLQGIIMSVHKKDRSNHGAMPHHRQTSPTMSEVDV